jgi:type II secretory pathway pseudopilin PulG
MSKIFPKKGFTLLELLLFLAIATSIIMLSFRFGNYYSFRSNVEKLKGGVNVTLLLMNQYYRANCKDDIDTSLLQTRDLDYLKNWAATTNTFSSQELNQIQNPLGDMLTIQYSKPNAAINFYQFVISAHFPNLTPGKIKLLQAELGADAIITNDTLTWTRVPRLLEGKGSSDLWIASAALQNKNDNRANIQPPQHPACPL